MSNKDKRQERGQDMRTPHVIDTETAAKEALRGKQNDGSVPVPAQFTDESVERYAARMRGDVLPNDKPTPNVPKALHHLRKAWNALGRESSGAVCEALKATSLSIIEKTAYPATRTWTDKDGDECSTTLDEQHGTERIQLAAIAAALDLDHNATAAAADVRAAIEALG